LARRVRILIAGLLVAVMAAPLGQLPALASPSSDLAAKRKLAQAVQAELDRLSVSLEVLVERYNAAQDQLERTLKEVGRNRDDLRRAEVDLAGARTQLDRRARSLYISGPSAYIQGILTAKDIHDVLARTRYAQNVLRRDSLNLDIVGTARARVSQAGEALASQQARQVAAERALAAQRDEILSRQTQRRGILDSLNKDIARLVEQEKRRQEEERRRTAAAALAAARRRESAPTNRGGRSDLPPPGPSAGKALSVARQQLGKPYRWGATGPDSFDCSGLTLYSYREAGVSIPRTAAEQWYAGNHPDLAHLAPGDLVFFATNSNNASTIHHVGIYAGDGNMIHAPESGDVVRVSSIGRSDYFGATRVG